LDDCAFSSYKDYAQGGGAGGIHRYRQAGRSLPPVERSFSDGNGERNIAEFGYRQAGGSLLSTDRSLGGEHNIEETQAGSGSFAGESNTAEGDTPGSAWGMYRYRQTSGSLLSMDRSLGGGRSIAETRAGLHGTRRFNTSEQTSRSTEDAGNHGTNTEFSSMYKTAVETFNEIGGGTSRETDGQQQGGDSEIAKGEESLKSVYLNVLDFYQQKEEHYSHQN